MRAFISLSSFVTDSSLTGAVTVAEESGAMVAAAVVVLASVAALESAVFSPFTEASNCGVALSDGAETSCEEEPFLPELGAMLWA
ncbi:MAG: hypothetical protein ABR906_12565 [Terracidiphilus sp.]